MSTRALALAVLVAAPSAAVADATFHEDLPPEAFPGVFEVAPQPHALGVKYLYINRCRGGCIITKGGDDARTHSTNAPDDPVGTKYTLSEYQHGDDSWNALMTCLREVYSPYDIIVTDEAPPAGMPYNEGIAAGTERELNVSGMLGYAYLNDDCSPRAYAISFTFANEIPGTAINTICRVVAQETAHSFGLRHSFEYGDGRSACNDPMSYRTDCGGQRFFRNEPARCGEYEATSCGGCGGLQNTHARLTTILGAATPLTPPPTVTPLGPADGAQVGPMEIVSVRASSKRGVARVELWVNGYKWAETKGGGWGSNGQPETTYSIALPPDLPDGVLDIVMKVKDDIDLTTETPQITVTKGAPCTSADTCATGQLCEQGRCYWEPPVGEVGDECTYKQFCKNELCVAIDSGEQRCSQDCVQGIADSCPEGFTCLENGNFGGGVCWPGSPSEGGNCGCSSSGELPVSGTLFGLGVLGLIVRRRRR